MQEADQRVLDLSLIDKSLKERLPTHGLAASYYAVSRQQAEGGILIPDPNREREALATVVAYVLKLGLAYQDPNRTTQNLVRRGSGCVLVVTQNSVLRSTVVRFVSLMMMK